MSRVKCDVEGVVIRMNQIGDRAVRGIADMMRAEAQVIQRIAVGMAPIDEGNLEEGIKVRESRSGLNRRVGVEVYVDLDMPAPRHNSDGTVTRGTENRTLRDYAILMHEGLAPFGTGFAGDLGPLSAAKDGGSGLVGGKYMERAAAARMQFIVRSALDITKRSLR